MQGTAACHHQIADACFPQAEAVFDDATTLDTAVDVLDPQPTLVERLLAPLLRPGQLLAAGFLGWHEALHLRERAGQEAQILQEPAPRREGLRRRVRKGLLMRAAAIRVTEKKGGVSNVDIDGNNALSIKTIEAVISTFETLPSLSTFQEGVIRALYLPADNALWRNST